jgi:hypothetical protein
VLRKKVICLLHSLAIHVSYLFVMFKMYAAGEHKLRQIVFLWELRWASTLMMQLSWHLSV